MSSNTQSSTHTNSNTHSSAHINLLGGVLITSQRSTDNTCYTHDVRPPSAVRERHGGPAGRRREVLIAVGEGEGGGGGGFATLPAAWRES